MKSTLEVKITEEVKQEAIVEHIRKACALSLAWELIEEDSIIADTFVFKLKDKGVRETIVVTVTHDEAVKIIRDYIIKQYVPGGFMPEGYTLTAEYPTLGEYTFEKED